MSSPLPDRLRVVARWNVGNASASATIISPLFAIAVDHDLPPATTEATLSSPLWSSAPVQATVTHHDAALDFALLRLAHPIADVPDDILLDASDPETNATWTCPVPEPERAQYSGTVAGHVSKDGRTYLRLSAGEHAPEARGWSGAPVFVGGRIVGIVALRDDRELLALPIRILATSTRISAVADLLPLDDPAFLQQLSPSSLTAISVAARLTLYSGQRRIHMEHVILGLYAKKDGPTENLFKDVGLDPGELRKVLKGAVEADIPSLPNTPPSHITTLPELSGHVRDAFRYGRNIARAHRSDRIQSRHLLYGVLSVEECTVVKALLDHGVDKTKIALTDARAMVKAFAIAGYRSDEVAGEDLLGIRKEVESLCIVLAAKNVEPPLSLGLFGEWGSGKSFFMGEMENWFNELSKMSDEERQKSPYCSRIVQLKFNAWHYSDTNLWATLTSAILQGLADTLAGKQDDKSDYQRAVLQTKKAKAHEKLTQALQKIAQAQSAIQAAETSPGLLARESLRAAVAEPESKKKLTEAFSDLGIPAVQDAAAGLERELLEVKGIWDTLAFEVRHTSSLRLSIFAGASIVAVLLMILLLHWAAGKGLKELLASVTAILTGASLGAERILAPIRRVLTSVTRVREKAQAAIDERLAREQHRITQAQDEVQEARAVMADIDRDLENLRPDRQMIDFINQRSQSADYIAQLGTISHARKDFEQLTTLLRRVRQLTEAPDSASPEQILPRIDRIILYIDDLDRCPEDKVVKVLQAVHLLLAFKLFVVVVGVDPRWMVHSLRQHSTAFQTSSEEANGTSREEAAHWRSTPFNYLEKIFQIPFTLRPMGNTGFKHLVESLIKPLKKTAVVDEKRSGPTGAVVAPEPSGHEHQKQVVHREEVPALGASDTKGAKEHEEHPLASTGKSGDVKPNIPMDAVQLEITDWECHSMVRLRDLIPSPRVAKRFVNIYRLLRTSVEEKDWTAFVGDERSGYHRPVLMMLAMLMGYPEETTDFLRAVIELHMAHETGPVERTFWQLVEEFEKRPTATDESGVSLTSDTDHWTELIGKIRRIRDLVPDDYLCLDLRDYASAVARYSFQSGRVLLAEPVASPKPFKTGGGA